MTHPSATLLLLRGPEDLGLADRVERALRATGHGALRAVVVSVSAGAVNLLGRVPTYYLKQIAEATALGVQGANEVRNALDVVPPN